MSLIGPAFAIVMLGAIARTATNIGNGASSPPAALAAIPFVVAWNKSEARHFAHVLKAAPSADRAILVITFLPIVFADLVAAVHVAVILAILRFQRRMAEAVATQPVDGQDLQAE